MSVGSFCQAMWVGCFGMVVVSRLMLVGHCGLVAFCGLLGVGCCGSVAGLIACFVSGVVRSVAVVWLL